ncbi:hypothetical protein K0M31_014467 [Melipona bicolor]|uniref:Uncharacterized protein n=1 Tax=Melipona bicolor TaxID=60889 RepID=A0AA40KUD3_9HYME|nr:hypothetical protein K0M31_014467 [Melipona bicolor]
MRTFSSVRDLNVISFNFLLNKIFFSCRSVAPVTCLFEYYVFIAISRTDPLQKKTESRQSKEVATRLRVLRGMFARRRSIRRSRTRIPIKNAAGIRLAVASFRLDPARFPDEADEQLAEWREPSRFGLRCIVNRAIRGISQTAEETANVL